MKKIQLSKRVSSQHDIGLGFLVSAPIQPFCLTENESFTYKACVLQDAETHN